MFSPDQFLDMQVTEANDTKIVPVPVGEYNAVVSEVKVVSWQKKDDPSTAGLKLQIIWELDSPEVKALLQRDKVTVRQDQMLDLIDGGGLDMGRGRNVGLGRLREATGLNTPGQPFSFTMLTGRMAKVSIKHRVDGDTIYSEVKGVAKIA